MLLLSTIYLVKNELCTTRVQYIKYNEHIFWIHTHKSHEIEKNYIDNDILSAYIHIWMTRQLFVLPFFIYKMHSAVFKWNLFFNRVIKRSFLFLTSHVLYVMMRLNNNNWCVLWNDTAGDDIRENCVDLIGTMRVICFGTHTARLLYLQ